ncbi:MAG: NAD(P)-binding domain-containing protein [Eubacteriaceae bacterium]|nr:NAD(P)-binding domain-containing protein [Eubacteriaceae bacterium]
MLNINTKLKALEEQGRRIRVGLVGAGQMGTGLISQISGMKGICVVITADHHPEKAVKAYQAAGIPVEMIKTVDTMNEAEAAVKSGSFAVTADYEILCRCGQVDVVIDATGNTDSGAMIAPLAIENGKHIVMLNVEADATVGAILKQRADAAGVIYTASSGDEPGAIKELYDFADALGYEILVIGKGKNNSPDYECNPDTVRAEAVRRGISPNMLTSFKDCTNTMIEMSSISNATGFVPDVIGMHGVTVTYQNACDVMRLRTEGGVLSSYGVVDYAYGLDPGVFLIFTTDKRILHDELQYLKMGTGPNYMLWRPYHFCSMETPLTCARAVIYNEPCLIPLPGAPVSDAVAVAKKDIAAGEYIDGIGGYYTYATMEKHEEAMKNDHVPIGIINKRTRAAVPIEKGRILTRDLLVFDEASPAYCLRIEQEKTIG